MPRLTHTILPSLMICGLCLLLFAACTENTVSDSIDVDAQVALQSDARTAMSDARTAMSDMGSSTSDASRSEPDASEVPMDAFMLTDTEPSRTGCPASARGYDVGITDV